MKKSCLLFSLALVTIIATAQSQSIKITGTRFTFPLFKKWIAEYHKIHPEVTITIGSGISSDSSDIVIASHILKPGDVKDGQQSITVARYAQLPVVNSERADLRSLLAKGFTDASFRQIYFSVPPVSNDSTAAFIVYKRQKAACSSVAFANHFGNEHKDIKGIGVPGDDQDLLEAVKKDKNAISHNSLGIIYNLQTRKLNDSIAIIPIDLNENGKVDQNENIYSTVDEVVAFVERTNNTKIPVENIHVIFSKAANNKVVTDFLKWVIIKGTQFNHAYGMLNLDPGVVQAQEELLSQVKSFSSCTPSLAQLKTRTLTNIHKN